MRILVPSLTSGAPRIYWLVSLLEFAHRCGDRESLRPSGMFRCIGGSWVGVRWICERGRIRLPAFDRRAGSRPCNETTRSAKRTAGPPRLFSFSTRRSAHERGRSGMRLLLLFSRTGGIGGIREGLWSLFVRGRCFVHEAMRLLGKKDKYPIFCIIWQELSVRLLHSPGAFVKVPSNARSLIPLTSPVPDYLTEAEYRA